MESSVIVIGIGVRRILSEERIKAVVTFALEIHRHLLVKEADSELEHRNLVRANLGKSLDCIVFRKYGIAVDSNDISTLDMIDNCFPRASNSKDATPARASHIPNPHTLDELLGREF